MILMAVKDTSLGARTTVPKQGCRYDNQFQHKLKKVICTLIYLTMFLFRRAPSAHAKKKNTTFESTFIQLPNIIKISFYLE